RSDARRDRLRVLRGRRVHGAPEPHRRDALARDVLRVPRLPAVQPPAAAAGFMGDSGSQVLGFALAALGLASSWTTAQTTVATLLLPILVLAVPILDTTLVTIVRLIEGRPITQGGRDHTSHRLVYQGLSDKRAVVLLGVVSATLGLTSLAYKTLDDTRITLIGVLLTFAFL